MNQPVREIKKGDTEQYNYTHVPVVELLPAVGFLLL